MDFLPVLKEGLPYLLQGTWITLVVVCGALALGLSIGLPLAVGTVYGPRWLRRLIGLYVWFFRGVPLLVLLFLFDFGIFPFLGLDLSAFTVAVIVLGCISGAYQSQILRGAILSVPAGQMKAARAVGMSDTQAIVLIVLPQALRLAIPGWSNEYAILLKDSAVTYALGVAEIMARAHHVASRTYQHLPIYISAGLLFMVLTFAGTRLLGAVHKRVRIKGYA
uniref:Amino acid ABC transporter permease n=1 Tax=Desulfacinum infernum TaxID=35837 RepID=A0A832E938_9BACT